MPIYDYHGNEISVGGGTSYDWSGKKICFEGDSITANNGIGYPAYVCSALGATQSNIAISGVPVYGKYPNNSYDFRRRISNIPADSDAIVILGDTNAYGAEALGSTDYFSTSVDDWTGRWNLAVNAIKKSFPTVPLFLVACFRQATKEDNAKYVAHFFQRLAQHYGCLFIDLSTESSMNLLFSSSVWGLQATDGTHPSKAAMPLFAEIVLNHIKQIKPCSFTGTDTISIASTLSVVAGETAAINSTLTGDLSVQWTSSDMSVACVMGGTVYGMSAGTAVITATTRNRHTATCTVTVSEP